MEAFAEALRREDVAALHAAVERLPAEALPEARKLAEQLADSTAAEQLIRSIDDRAAELGVALSA